MRRDICSPFISSFPRPAESRTSSPQLTAPGSRPVAEKLIELTKQPFIVDYRAGANGLIGSEYVAKSPPDGYTLLIISSSFAINPSTQAKMPFDPVRDFAAVSPVSTSDIILVVN